MVGNQNLDFAKMSIYLGGNAMFKGFDLPESISDMIFDGGDNMYMFGLNTSTLYKWSGKSIAKDDFQLESVLKGLDGKMVWSTGFGYDCRDLTWVSSNTENSSV